MSGQTTTITNPEDPEDVRKFAFDHSYWSHDGAQKLEDGYFAPKEGARYVGQVDNLLHSIISFNTFMKLCK